MPELCDRFSEYWLSSAGCLISLGGMFFGDICDRYIQFMKRLDCQDELQITELMIFCINPDCKNPQNLDHELFCQSCGSELLLEGCYRVIQSLKKGGFGQIYEVREGETTKILKVLLKKDPKAVELFEREFKVLSQLHHPGIPLAEEYFTLFPKNSQEPLHCLVMEKIEGLNLEEYLEQRENRPISQKQAINWLTQLAQILHEVHQRQLFHRDIKPSNIMLTSNGQLVLIDFGIAREITETYGEKQAAGQITKYHTPGYAPLEQEIGKAVPQSDFFALGRTFVYLLTGKHPQDIGNNYRDPNTDDDWDWREEAPDISPNLADFIDCLMARAIKNRPTDTGVILERLEEIEQSLYPIRLSRAKQSKEITPINGQNISLEYSLGDIWDSSGHSKAVRCLAISADGETLASGSDDETIKVWNLTTKEAIYTFRNLFPRITIEEFSQYELFLSSQYKYADNLFRLPIRTVAITPDGKLASVSVCFIRNSIRNHTIDSKCDHKVRFWKLNTGEQIEDAVTGHSDIINSVLISPNGKTYVTGGDDTTVRVWNLKTHENIRTFAKHSNAVTCLATNSDGRILASGSKDGRIIIWPKGQKINGHQGFINSVAISPDGEILVSGSNDRTVKVWNLNTGEEICTFAEHEGAVNSVAISPDGQTIVSGSDDGTIKFWNIGKKEVICTLDGHVDGVNVVAFSADGRILASGGGDCTIKVWRVN
ncbi:MAG: protein kinase [Symploca sp. SIO2E9]|nr:protein kinase [Symploca sp. SIO2E9]